MVWGSFPEVETVALSVAAVGANPVAGSMATTGAVRREVVKTPDTGAQESPAVFCAAERKK